MMRRKQRQKRGRESMEKRRLKDGEGRAGSGGRTPSYTPRRGRQDSCLGSEVIEAAVISGGKGPMHERIEGRER
jgi:hypothetical protein